MGSALPRIVIQELAQRIDRRGDTRCFIHRQQLELQSHQRSHEQRGNHSRSRRCHSAARQHFGEEADPGARTGALQETGIALRLLGRQAIRLEVEPRAQP